MSHTWKHFLGVVPWVRFLQGRKVRRGVAWCLVPLQLALLPLVRVRFASLCPLPQHTWYCGAYTLFNTHELAVISGFAVAERLGAPYPFEDNELARLQYNNLMKVCRPGAGDGGADGDAVCRQLTSARACVTAITQVSHGIDREKRMKRAAKKEARAQRKKKD